MSEIEQLCAETQMMEEMAVRLNGDMRRAAAAVEEAAAAVSAIKSLRGGQESEVLLQLGMGAMLRASLPSVERIPVDVGAGVVIEKSPDAAINYLEIRIKELKVSLDEMVSRRDQVVGNMEQKRRRLEELARSAQPAPNT